MTDKVISFVQAKNPHLEARKSKKLAEMQGAFKAARKGTVDAAKVSRKKKASKSSRSKKK